MNLLFLLAIYVLSSVNGQNEIPTTQVGPCHRRPNGFARDLDSCSDYFYCENGHARRGHCPNNLLFDANNEWCYWREEVTCFQCPRNQVFALLPVPKTCYQYYRCWMGAATIHSCPSGLVFDPNMQRCSLVTGTGCEGDETPEEGCPAVDGPEPTYLVHATNCRLYFVCSNGVPLERQCAQGLHFNPVLRACDTPENANCQAEDGAENPPDDGGPGGEGPAEQTPAIPCPREGLAFRPHRENCNAYFACSEEEPQLINCAPHLHWDYVRSTCDFPRNARCWSRENPPQAPPSNRMLLNNSTVF